MRKNTVIRPAAFNKPERDSPERGDVARKKLIEAGIKMDGRILSGIRDTNFESGDLGGRGLSMNTERVQR